MSYTPPAGDALAFSWVGAVAATSPAGDALAFSWGSVTGEFTATVTVAAAFAGAHGVRGEFAASVPVTAAFAGLVSSGVEGEFVATVPVSAAFTGAVGVSGTFGASVPVTAGFAGAHGVSAQASGQVAVAAAFSGAHGVRGEFAASVPVSAAFAGIVYRYEVRGEARDNGVLVNRRVRAYGLTSGELLGQSDTVSGRFHVHTGFTQELVTVVSIDLGDLATDYQPPCENRVLTVLAQDDY